MAFDFNFNIYAFPSTIEELDNFTGKEFERFLFEFFKIMNCKPTITDDTADRGIDITIQKQDSNSIKIIGIQAKRWKQNINSVEITKMLEGKNYYKADELWLITTADLTQQAQNTALNNNIAIINREMVINMLDDLKSIPNIKFRELPKSTTNTVFKQIEYLNTKEEIKENIDENLNVDTKEETIDKIIFSELKYLRNKLSKELKLFPVYMIYGNETIEDIIEKLPLDTDELFNIKGLGMKKIELFGEQIIKIINDILLNIFEDEITNLTATRNRIYIFNNLENANKAFNDKALKRLIYFKPKNLNELEQIQSFPKENIEIFGNYLITQLNYL